MRWLALIPILLLVVAACNPIKLGQAAEVTAPSNAAAPNPTTGLNGVSCTSARNCVAVGSYTDTSGKIQAWAGTETHGAWGQATEVTAPSNAASNPGAFFTGVSCSSPGNCTAVGIYSANTSNEEGMAATETNGTWGPATEVAAPSNVTPPNQLTTIIGWRTLLNGVSCTSPGNCVAVGEYITNSFTPQGWVATETGGTWGQATEVTAPSNASASLQGVSCTSPGNCVAVGEIAGEGGSLAATETNGTWGQATAVTAPSNGSGRSYLGKVSCTSPGNCGAVGGYINSSQQNQAMAATESGGTWQQATEVPAPSNAGSSPTSAEFRDVSCTSAGNCLAVGDYFDNSGAQQAMETIETRGTWQQATEVTPPSNANSSPTISITALNGVSCTLVGKCVGVGTYQSTSGHAAMAASSL